MRRPHLVFAASIALPSLLLGGLALRAAFEQSYLVERRTAALYQKYTNLLAERARRQVEEQREEFSRAVDRLVHGEDPGRLAADFSERLAAALPGARAGFAVGLDGRILSPTAEQARGSPELAAFLADNTTFLSNQAPAEFFQEDRQIAQVPADLAGKFANTQRKAARNVVPQQALAASQREPSPSDLTTWTADFASLVSASASGSIARFVRDRLELLHWSRAPGAPGLVFGAVVAPGGDAALWQPLVTAADLALADACIALLDERGRPVVRAGAAISPDWRRPFVATEIGDLLPHWEAALYLSDPARLGRSAQSLTFTLVLLVAAALLAIAWGAYAVTADTRRQLELAAKKSDFVASVSHELKTPLTSIRMFAELLAQDRVVEPGRRAEYLRIIAVEAERLTRLIDNVLDFSRLERGKKKLDPGPLDVQEVLASAWQAQEPRLRAAGLLPRLALAPGPHRARADADALTQVVVNLLGNAEKHAAAGREVTLVLERDGEPGGTILVRVLDRGPGVSAAAAAQLFEPFARGNDSLAGGGRGAGLGLALSRALAREMDGDLTYRPREGGGSEFTLRLPAAEGAGA